VIARAARTDQHAAGASVPVLNLTPFLLFLVAGGAWIGAIGILDQDYQIFWFAVALSCYLSALFLLVFSRTRGFGLSNFRLGPWFLGYAVISYGVASLTLIEPLDASLWAIDKSSYPPAFAVISGGFTAWAIGYVAGGRGVLKRAFSAGKAFFTKGLSESIRGRGLLLVVFLVAVGADVFGVVVDGKYGYLGDSSNITSATVQWYGQPLFMLSNLKYVALFGAAARVYVEGKDKALPLLIPIACVTVVSGLMTGMKESFVACLLSIAIPYFIGKGKLRLVPMVLALVVFVGIVAPAVGALRGDVRGSAGRLDVNSAIGAAADRIFSPDTYLDPSGSSSVESVSSRVRLVDNTALIIQKTPTQIPFRSLDELAIAPLSGLIPRVFWPDKPVQISGYEFYKNYYGGVVRSSSAITLSGSFYLFGGTIFVVSGMFLVGLSLRSLDDALDARSTLSGALFVAIVFITIVKQEMDVSTFLATVPVLTVTWIIGSKLIFSRQSRSGERSAKDGHPERKMVIA
jgi:hypothetical protein